MALTQIDRDLINRCLERQSGAWRDFVKRFMGLFIHVINHTIHAHSVRSQPDEIDDLCSEVFVSILADDMRVLRKFRGKSSLASYLTVIARRVTLKRLLQKNRSQAFGHVDAHGDSLEKAKVEVSPIERLEDRDEIDRLMQQLPPQEAEILKLFHLDGLTYQEIHTRTGIPENTIGSTLSRVRSQLKRDNLRV
jgi:RNA polymerase sigma-70 factor (ECF subfamily)